MSTLKSIDEDNALPQARENGLARPLRIAMVGGFAWEPLGSIRLRAFPLAAALVQRGHSVNIFLPPYNNRTFSGKEFETEGVRVVNTKVPSSRIGYPLILFSLVREVRSFRPDIVHVFKPKGFAGAAGTILRLFGFPVVLDCDDWEGWGGWNDVKPYPRLIKEYIDFQEKWLIRHSSTVTVASRFLEGRALDAGAKRGVTLIPNCGVAPSQVALQYKVAALDRVAERHAAGIPLDKRVIFFNGHFEPGDDLGFLCRVCANVARRTGALLFFTGDGPLLKEVQDTFASQPIDVKYLPRLPYEAFLRAIAVSDITVFPYPDNPLHRSKCSTRIVDYMVMAKPVLTNAVGMNLEYIVDGKSGILSPPGDEIRFEFELERLVRDPDWCEFLGRNAQHRIREQFAWDRSPVNSCLDIYARVLDQSH